MFVPIGACPPMVCPIRVASGVLRRGRAAVDDAIHAGPLVLHRCGHGAWAHRGHPHAALRAGHGAVGRPPDPTAVLVDAARVPGRAALPLRQPPRLSLPDMGRQRPQDLPPDQREGPLPPLGVVPSRPGHTAGTALSGQLTSLSPHPPPPPPRALPRRSSV